MADRHYKSLNDASSLIPGLAPGTTKIWYTKPGSDAVRRGLSYLSDRQPESLPTKDTLMQTHVLLGEVKESDPERLFIALQGERWSPMGEAAQLIQGLGLWHTSMSVGDVLEIDGHLLFCDIIGFEPVPVRGD